MEKTFQLKQKQGLKFQQKRVDGSWDGDVKTTAMVLYALTDEVYTPITPINTIKPICTKSVITEASSPEMSV